MSASSSRTSVSPVSPPKEHWIGRFSFSLPEALRRVGQEYRLRSFVHIKEVEWSSERRCEGEWRNWLHHLAERRPPPGTREVIVEHREIAPRCRGVLAHDSEYDPSILTWFALLDAGTHGVWLECTQKARASAQALLELASVVRSYLALDVQAQRPLQEWFFLERGVVTLPPSDGEQVIVQFDGFPLDVKLEFCTRPAVAAGAEAGLLSRFHRALDLGLQGEMKMEILHAGSRVVAGLEGEELIFRIEDALDSHVSWGWLCPGRANDPRSPRVEFTMHSRDLVRESKTHIWDAMLNSMRPLRP